jgi:hypothetical protein
LYSYVQRGANRVMTIEKIDKLSSTWLLQRIATLEHQKAILLDDNARLLALNEALKAKISRLEKPYLSPKTLETRS